MKKRVSVGDFRIGPEEKAAINEVLDSGRISEAEKVREFEKEWAAFVGTKFALALNSGTSALIAGLTAFKYLNNLTLNDSRKIITTPLTYVATSNAIKVSGFEPVYVDVNRKTFGLQPEALKKYLEGLDSVEDYSLVLPVHLMGFPCRMDALTKIARKYGLSLFEDSAQAHGSDYEGKKTGSMSLASAFSFYIAHNIQAGEMGALVTNDYEFYRLAKKIKANGRECDCPICLRSQNQCPKILRHKGEKDYDPRFSHDLIGFNFKAMEFQAALALVQLKKANQIIKKRQANVKFLNEFLEKFQDKLQLPEFSKRVSYLAYPLVLKENSKISRKTLRSELEKLGVETRPLFGCIPTQQKSYSYLAKQYAGKLSNAEFLGLNAFYIGCHQYLEQEDLKHVVNAFESILE